MELLIYRRILGILKPALINIVILALYCSSCVGKLNGRIADQMFAVHQRLWHRQIAHYWFYSNVVDMNALDALGHISLTIRIFRFYTHCNNGVIVFSHATKCHAMYKNFYSDNQESCIEFQSQVQNSFAKYNPACLSLARISSETTKFQAAITPGPFSIWSSRSCGKDPSKWEKT